MSLFLDLKSNRKKTTINDYGGGGGSGGGMVVLPENSSDMPRAPQFIIKEIPLVDLTSDSDEDPVEDYTPATPVTSHASSSPTRHPHVSDDDTPNSEPRAPSAPLIQPEALPLPPQGARRFRRTAHQTSRTTTTSNNITTHEVGEPSRPATTQEFVTREDHEQWKVGAEREKTRVSRLTHAMHAYSDWQSHMDGHIKGIYESIRADQRLFREQMGQIWRWCIGAIIMAILAVVATCVFRFLF